MPRRLVCLLAALALLPGCVPVTEPLSDVTRAEPDKGLVGDWREQGGRDGPTRIDVPDVKGNPKGLMRLWDPKRPDGRESRLWFFTTKVGGHTYANVLMGEGPEIDYADFREAGAFARWGKSKTRHYVIAHYKLDGDTLTIRKGDLAATVDVMNAEKVPGPERGAGENDVYFRTPAGALAKYLAKNGPDKLFPATEGTVVVLKRAKKK